MFSSQLTLTSFFDNTLTIHIDIIKTFCATFLVAFNTHLAKVVNHWPPHFIILVFFNVCFHIELFDNNISLNLQGQCYYPFFPLANAKQLWIVQVFSFCPFHPLVLLDTFDIFFPIHTYISRDFIYFWIGKLYG